MQGIKHAKGFANLVCLWYNTGMANTPTDWTNEMKVNWHRTARGFKYVGFKDSRGNECRVQHSSVIDNTDQGMENPGSSYLWVGVMDANPRIMASQALKYGIPTTVMTGFVPFPIPEEVLLTTRMHLDREQVVQLIAVLQQWLDD